MKIFNSFRDVPPGASYIGSEDDDGGMTEEVADAIDAAIEPACYRDINNQGHYFDLFQD